VQLLVPKNHQKQNIPFVLVFDQPEHAHIYAPDSEDSPTNIEWHLPKGVTLDHIKWPPLQSLSLHGHKFQAYEGKVYVHGTFVLEDSVHDLNALKADISYTVCDKLCTPEKTTQTISFIESFEWDALPKPHAALGFFSFHMALMFLFALIGGVILNLMPCVLPILSLKIMTLAQHSQPKKLKASGIFFTLGTVVSFWVLAGLLLAFRAAGHQVGWGFQLQSPAVVTALIFVFFAFALNLFGVFEIGTSLTKLSSKGGDSSTPMGSFFHGVLACVVATPCSAPFMGASVGFALTQSPLHGFAVFTGLALGLSAPYLLVCLNPKTAKFLPKPGGWMHTFKTILGFGMAASVLWLMHVLADQVSIAVFLNVLVALLALSIAAWIYGYWGGVNRAPYLRLFATATAIALVSAAYLYATKPIEELKADPWIAYNSTTVENLRKKSPVLIDFTAKWCITCQVNKQMVLNTSKAHQLFKDKNVQLVKADWTTYDPSITKALEQYGRSSVPLYVLLYPNGRHKVLPELLTFSILKEALADLG
jgi:thiol:disulfide interchange protein DsbD